MSHQLVAYLDRYQWVLFPSASKHKSHNLLASRSTDLINAMLLKQQTEAGCCDARSKLHLPGYVFCRHCIVLLMIDWPYRALLQHADDRVKPPEVGAVCFDSDIQWILAASSRFVSGAALC